MNKGVLIVISGFSGVGKGELTKRLIERYPHEYELSVSMTTREPRAGEIEGKSYFFVSREKFEEAISKGSLIEYASYCDNYYGSPRDYVESHLAEGRNVILEIEMQGAIQIKESEPDALLIFVMAPSIRTGIDRLRNRGSEDEEKIRKRIMQAKSEVELIEEYEYIIVNDDLNESVESLHNIIVASKNSPGRNREFISRTKEELYSL